MATKKQTSSHIVYDEVVMNFDYEFTLPKKQHWTMSKWCEQQFGPRWEAVGYREGIWCTFWAGRDMPTMYKWYFKNHEDATVFLLRWS